jgi:hypothetical protein
MLLLDYTRNDPCPCGSGKKFKKCCQERVDAMTKRLLQTVGAGYSAIGLEIARALGLYCGLQVEDEANPPDPELLGRLLTESWKIKEQDFQMDDLGKLLSSKEHLLGLRLPVYLLIGVDIRDDESSEDIVEQFVRQLPSDYYDFVQSQMVLSLRKDSYTEAEARNLLVGFSCAMIDQEAREALLECISMITVKELQAAIEEYRELVKDVEDKIEESKLDELRRFFTSHPYYDDYMSAQLTAEARPALKAIIESGGLEIPFYAIAGGLYAMSYELLKIGEEYAEKQQEPVMEPDAFLRLLHDMLWEQDAVFFLPALHRAIKTWAGGDRTDELSSSLEPLRGLLFGFFMSAQIKMTQNLYLFCIRNMANNMPLTLPGVDAPVQTFLDLCDARVIDPYCDYLESQQQSEEASHVKQQFQAWSEKIRQISEDVKD